MQRPPVNLVVTGIFPARLTAVSEMAQYRRHACRLRPLDPFRAQRAAQIRILAETIRQSTIKRTAHNSHIR